MPFDLEIIDRLHSTTHAVRKCLDPTLDVRPENIHECIALSQQAATGSSSGAGAG